jgi:hypothetical protein
MAVRNPSSSGSHPGKLRAGGVEGEAGEGGMTDIRKGSARRGGLWRGQEMMERPEGRAGTLHVLARTVLPGRLGMAEVAWMPVPYSGTIQHMN